ncbi:xanthine dehydrogenase family protein molybdopterin-binding subunit [Pelagicoccus mobilis]|uniref:Xanthine dehydrogenase family protein molybdopterin-binding subunit n=1 Tax=Pelagicoccus mobilis TaxID=415221 RepID=A0A934S2C5_9BACT|nr:molybdopterin cofactor-binding domain-containing protein [Pelagicoccus mobilis]MBK1877788.1 xanthine dehydrogenase family protein molybdopterin-binding subunit [Pelagicoccus mobilis]
MIAKQSRRSFVENLGKGGAFLLGLAYLPKSMAVASSEAASFAPNLFVAIDGEGTVTVVCHRSEMGQQIRTSVAQVIADELEADWDRVKIEQATGDAKYGDQNTDGSRSMRHNLERLRQAGATARTMLEQAAAQKWGVDASQCKAEGHQIVNTANGKTLGYGELIAAAAKLEVPAEDSLTLKPRKKWRYIGKVVRSLDNHGAVTGQNVFGQDKRVPGMKFAVVARPPVVFGKVKSYDAKAALAVPGVERVVEMKDPGQKPPGFKPLGGIAVVAKNTWAAMKGRDLLEIEWEDGDNSGFASKDYRQTLESSVSAPGKVVREEGDVDAALSSGDKKLVADYYVPLMSHVQMEPPAAVAIPGEDSMEIYACVQAPQGARKEVAGAVGLELEQVTVNVTFLGGGFGRKSKPDFVVEAALIAKEIGAPIKVVWTREDDVRHGYYHFACAQHFEATLDGDGKTDGWLHRTAFPPIASTFAPGANEPFSFELDLGFTENPFQVPNLRLESCKADAHVRIGWMRSVGNINHAFAIQCFAAELAEAAGRDPKDYLLELIGEPRKIDLTHTPIPYGNYGDPIEKYPVDTARLIAVVKKAAEMADWGRTLPKGRGLGIACHRSFLTYVATAVEVEVSNDGEVRIPKAWVAADAGTVVNLDAVKAQCEGGTIFGFSCVLEEITATAGRIDQSNYHDVRVTRMNESPTQIDVAVIESDAPPAGVGEPATPPAAPALCNAIYAATGKRIRSLPLGNQLA